MSSTSAIFLDRDGTLIVEKEYLSDPEAVEFERGVIEGLHLLRATRRPLVVLTNQSGVGRGYFCLEAALAVNARIEERLREHGIFLAGWYLCPHSPDERCECRKPSRALADRAARDLSISLDDSFVIGDKKSDLQLATAIGATGILVMTGHGAADAEWARSHKYAVVHSFLAAAAHVLSCLSQSTRAVVL